MATIVRISEQYGEEAGVGGDVEWYTGSVVLTASKQTYDLNAWASTQGIASRDIEIKQVFYQQVPAVTRFFDPYAGTGQGITVFNDNIWLGEVFTSNIIYVNACIL